MPSGTVASLIDEFERVDQWSALDTLRLETPDDGMDRTLEISQVVPHDGGGHALAVSARLSIKDDPYKGVRFDIRGYARYAVHLD